MVLALTGLSFTSHAFNALYSKFVCPHQIRAQRSAPLLCLLSDCVCKIAPGPACGQSALLSFLEPDITGLGHLHTQQFWTLQLGRSASNMNIKLWTAVQTYVHHSHAVSLQVPS